MLTVGQISLFHARGYLVLNDIITRSQAETIIDASERLAGALLKQTDNTVVSSSGSGEAGEGSKFLELVRLSRSDAGRVFDALIKIPLVNQIVYQEKLQGIACQLLGSDMVLAPPSQMNLRADHPEEGKFLYPWHTDYSYNASSSNSIVFWIPLQDVDLVNGALHIIPGSHNFKSKVRLNERAITAKMSSAYFSIENIDEALKEAGEIRCPLPLGKGVVFSSRLIHKSGVNQSNATRFALQSRWFDGLSEDAVQRKFRGGFDEGVHPRDYLECL